MTNTATLNTSNKNSRERESCKLCLHNCWRQSFEKCPRSYERLRTNTQCTETSHSHISSGCLPTTATLFCLCVIGGAGGVLCDWPKNRLLEILYLVNNLFYFILICLFFLFYTANFDWSKVQWSKHWHVLPGVVDVLDEQDQLLIWPYCSTSHFSSLYFLPVKLSRQLLNI